MGKKIYCVLGPSGSGKSVLVNCAKQHLNIEEIISHSTRSMREGEVDGDPYYFISAEEFESIDFIEKVTYSGNNYGISYQEVENKLSLGKDIVVIVDIEGIKQLKGLYPDFVEVVYIYSTAAECFERMLEERGSESAFERLANALLDDEFNNHDIADYIIRNKDLDKAKNQIINIIGGN